MAIFKKPTNVTVQEGASAPGGSASRGNGGNLSKDGFDYIRYGVDPTQKKKKKAKSDKPKLVQLLNPKNLQTEVSKYGYSFSAKRFYLSLLEFALRITD